MWCEKIVPTHNVLHSKSQSNQNDFVYYLFIIHFLLFTFLSISHRSNHLDCLEHKMGMGDKVITKEIWEMNEKGCLPVLCSAVRWAVQWNRAETRLSLLLFATPTRRGHIPQFSRAFWSRLLRFRNNFHTFVVGWASFGAKTRTKARRVVACRRHVGQMRRIRRCFGGREKVAGNHCTSTVLLREG